MSENADLAARVARLEDLEQIKLLKMRYARYADAGYDADGLASLFAPDAVWDGGSLFGRAEGTEAIRAQFVGAPDFIPWALHYVLAPQLEVDADGRHGRGTWYLWQPCTRRRRSGEEVQAWLAGTYDDTYVKLDGRWLFQTVEVRARWLQQGPPASTPIPDALTPDALTAGAQTPGAHTAEGPLSRGSGQVSR